VVFPNVFRLDPEVDLGLVLGHGSSELAQVNPSQPNILV